MRTRFETSVSSAEVIETSLRARAAHLGGTLQVRREDHRPKIAVLVSTADHCLLDLLYRWQTAELAADIAVVISNHEVLRETVERHGVPFVHVPVTADTKQASEDQLRAVIDEHEAELIVLARYMQVLSPELCADLAGRAINIHHSFLPGFKGAKPYHQAYERGVKLIGATAHYITAELDDGPIIDQDVERVSHHHAVTDLVTIGRDVERLVLSRAVRSHVEQRVFLVSDRTIVFP